MSPHPPTWSDSKLHNSLSSMRQRDRVTGPKVYGVAVADMIVSLRLPDEMHHRTSVLMAGGPALLVWHPYVSSAQMF